MPTPEKHNPHHNPAHDSHVEPGHKPSIEEGYEVTDVSVQGILVFLVGLFVCVGVFFVVCFGMGILINDQIKQHDGPVDKWNASLAEMANLAPGAVIDLGQRVDEQAVSVWVEQHCVGKGQLVAIGERLGVRLLSVFAGQSPGEPQRPAADGIAQKGT